jgi:hypothetical protein
MQSWLQAQPLMCYFHVKKACEDKLRGSAEKEVILQDIGDLHLTLTQKEFDMKFSVMFNQWLVNSSMFALYFYHQWVKGDFSEWQILHSTPGVAMTNNAVESLNASIKKYFTCRKCFKLFCFTINYSITFFKALHNFANINKQFRHAVQDVTGGVHQEFVKGPFANHKEFLTKRKPNSAIVEGDGCG